MQKLARVFEETDAMFRLHGAVNLLPLTISDVIEYNTTKNVKSYIRFIFKDWAILVNLNTLYVWKLSKSEDVVYKLNLQFQYSTDWDNQIILFYGSYKNQLSCVAASKSGSVRYWPMISRNSEYLECVCDKVGFSSIFLHNTDNFVILTAEDYKQYIINVMETPLICHSLYEKPSFISHIGKRLSSILNHSSSLDIKVPVCFLCCMDEDTPSFFTFYKDCQMINKNIFYNSSANEFHTDEKCNINLKNCLSNFKNVTLLDALWNVYGESLYGLMLSINKNNHQLFIANFEVSNNFKSSGNHVFINTNQNLNSLSESKFIKTSKNDVTFLVYNKCSIWCLTSVTKKQTTINIDRIDDVVYTLDSGSGDIIANIYLENAGLIYLKETIFEAKHLSEIAEANKNFKLTFLTKFDKNLDNQPYGCLLQAFQYSVDGNGDEMNKMIDRLKKLLKSDKSLSLYSTIIKIVDEICFSTSYRIFSDDTNTITSDCSTDKSEYDIVDYKLVHKLLIIKNRNLFYFNLFLERTGVYDLLLKSFKIATLNHIFNTQLRLKFFSTLFNNNFDEYTSSLIVDYYLRNLKTNLHESTNYITVIFQAIPNAENVFESCVELFNNLVELENANYHELTNIVKHISLFYRHFFRNFLDLNPSQYKELTFIPDNDEFRHAFLTYVESFFQLLDMSMGDSVTDLLLFEIFEDNCNSFVQSFENQLQRIQLVDSAEYIEIKQLMIKSRFHVLSLFIVKGFFEKAKKYALIWRDYHSLLVIIYKTDDMELLNDMLNNETYKDFQNFTFKWHVERGLYDNLFSEPLISCDGFVEFINMEKKLIVMYLLKQRNYEKVFSILFSSVFKQKNASKKKLLMNYVILLSKITTPENSLQNLKKLEIERKLLDIILNIPSKARNDYNIPQDDGLLETMEPEELLEIYSDSSINEKDRFETLFHLINIMIEKKYSQNMIDSCLMKIILKWIMNTEYSLD
ncbi:hypothetical protein A3Q56_05154 [Intoshia linei]|uniref:Nucleoporin Nup133/Nup155-like C-terminal domain-containing protein n=1 Tax=Intoshia linei TaxID=1819745 RepID=A0A177B080_9BILA|nr:hypothetical protein A3Q56_05154 [Intoshia linei]